MAAIFLPPANEVCEGYVFTGVCLSMGQGVRGCSGGGGHAWLLPEGEGACVVALGGVCGCSGGACVVAPGRHAWLLPGGHAWLLWGGMCGCLGGYMVALGGMHGCSGGCMVAPAGMHGCGGACVVALGGVHGCSWEGVHGCSGRHAWDTTRYGDTVNERVVCILLECILVIACKQSLQRLCFYR